MSFSSQPPFAEVLGSELLRNGLSFSPFRGCFGQVLFPQFSIVDSKTVQRSALCRSRRELSNEYLLANFGFDDDDDDDDDESLPVIVSNWPCTH